MSNTGDSVWIRSLLTASAVLTLLVSAWLLASGLFTLGTWGMVSFFHEGTKGLTIWAQRPRPPTPAELASEARNMAELARIYRQGITSTGIGALLLLVSAVAIGSARRAGSRSGDRSINAPD